MCRGTSRMCPWPYLVGLATVALVANAFNLDLETAQVYRGPNGSYFGYSVAQYFENGTAWVLAGAPLSEEADVGNVTQGGAVYRCPVLDVDPSGACLVFPIDTESEDATLEQKSGRWLGASIAVANGTILACAPGYVYKTMQHTARLPTGMCHLYQSGLDVTNIAPVLSDCDKYFGPSSSGTKFEQYDRYGVSQVGFSALLNKKGTVLALGGVGAFNWQGMAYTQSLVKPFTNYSTNVSEHGANNRYLGYSSCSGDFNGDGVDDFVFGMPRAWSLKGRVRVVNEDLTFILHKNGTQLGDYFGASVACGDFNGDGRADLVVGSPHYSEKWKTSSYEIGRVTVFYTIGMGTDTDLFYLNEDTVPGLVNGGRFGAALANLGDINADNLEDLAVGAPYGGSDHKGAVYIFMGSSQHALLRKPFQVIYGSSFSPVLQGFGFSLNGGKDLDNNAYADIVVGALNSDAVVFMRSRPVVRIEATLTVETPILKLRNMLCETPLGSKVTCLMFTTCFVYTGVNVPSNIDIATTLTLDGGSNRAQYLNGTLYGKSARTENISLMIMENYCETSHAFVQESNIRDKLSPITLDLTYSLLHESMNVQGPKPILDQLSPANITDTAKIWRDCGEDDTCIADLVLRAESVVPKYVLGSPELIQLVISVNNEGEDAFGAVVQTAIPPGVSFRSTTIIKSDSDIRCRVWSQEDDETVKYIHCGIGNPFIAGAMAQFQLTFWAKDFSGSSDHDHLSFQLVAYSHHPENETDDFNNEAIVVIPVEVRAKIKLTGLTKPNEIFFPGSAPEPDTVRSLNALGPEVIYIFEIQNQGPSSVSEVQFTAYWPSFFSGKSGNQKDLLYISYLQLLPEDKGSCTSLYIDYRNLTSHEPPLIGDNAPVTRRKRSILYANKAQNFDCLEPSGHCISVTCQIEDLEGGNTAVVEIRARLVSHTLIKADVTSLKVRSLAVATVTEVPYHQKPEEYTSDDKEITLSIFGTVQEKKVALWIIVTATLVGVLLLVIIAVILYKCGFFKRQTSMEIVMKCDKREARRSMRARESVRVSGQFVLPGKANGNSKTSPPVVTSPPLVDKENMEVILVGSKACVPAKLPDDDHVTMNVTRLVVDELRIPDAIKLLEGCLEAGIGEAVNAVVLHVGGYDFPVNGFEGMNLNVANFMKLVSLAVETCPNATVIMSSVLPRLGQDSDLVNQQVSHFNNTMSKMSIDEGRVYLDNDLHFEDRRGVMAVLYDMEDSKGISLNENGREKMGIIIQGVLKDILFKSKLHNYCS